MRRSSLPHARVVARGSSGATASRWLTSVPSVDDLAAGEELLVRHRRRLARGDVRPDVLEEQRLVLQRFARVGHRGQRVVVHVDELDGVHSPAAFVSVTTTATMSPAKRTFSDARNGLAHAGIDADERQDAG